MPETPVISRTDTGPLLDCRWHGGRQQHRPDGRCNACTGEILLCAGCDQPFDRLPAELRADHENTTAVAITPHDALNVLTGGTTYVADTDGNPVMLRLLTPAEVIVRQHDAINQAEARSLPTCPRITWEQAIDLVKPVTRDPQTGVPTAF